MAEVDDEGDGVQHVTDTIAGHLKVTLLCFEEELAVPDAELVDAVVKILAPLLAQRACLSASGQPPKRTSRSVIPSADLAVIDAFCTARAPAHATHQVRVEHTIGLNAITLIERRAP